MASALLLALASPALADSISIQVTNWRAGYTRPGGGYTMVGDIVDQDPFRVQRQCQVVTSKTLSNAVHYYLSPITGLVEYNMYGPDAKAPDNVRPHGSPYPQLVSLDGYGTHSEGHLYVDTLNKSAAEAAAVFAGGYWEFLYADGTTNSEIDRYFTGLPCGSPWGFSPTVADPVNAASGTSDQSATDLALPGIGLPLVFSRIYDSQRAQEPGPLGHGWRHAYDSCLDFPSDGLVWVTYPDGGRVPFHTLDGGASYTTVAPGAFETLARFPGGSYTLTFTDGTVYAYSAAGILTSLADRYGNQTTLTYQGSELTQVSDASGRSLAFTYQGGHITLVEAKAGGVTQQSVSFTYDGSGDLVTSTDANGHSTGYAYDSSHRLISVRQPKAMADPAKNPLFTNTYTSGRVTSQTDALGGNTTFVYDSVDQETTVTDARSHATTYAWDEEYRLTRWLDPLGHLSETAYGTNGLPGELTDANGHTTEFECDEQGNLTSTHDPQGHVTRAAYDEKNNPLWVQDALGERLSRTTSGLLLKDEFSADSLASYTSAVETATPTWSVASGLLSQGTRHKVASLARSGITGARCASAYLTPKYGSEAVVDLLVATGAADSTGKAFLGYSARLSTSQASIQKRTDGTWTSLASQSYSTPFGTYRQVRLYVKDGVVHMKAGESDLSEVDLNASDDTYTSGTGGVRAQSKCDYDYLELRSSHEVTVTGLPAGYLVRLCQGDDTAQATASGGSAVIDAGALLFPLDKVEIFNASATKVAELTSTDLGDMGGGDIFAYDANAGHRTTFAWDATGTYVDSVISPIGTTSFTWNPSGTLASLTDAGSHTWSYGYSAQGDLTSVTDPLSYQTSYTRDALGRTTAIEDANSSRTEYLYDPVGNLTTAKDPLAETDPGNRHQIDFTYDANDNVTSVTDARGHATAFAYDDMNCLTGVTDALLGQAHYGYDGCYNLTSVQDPNAHTTTYGYDLNDRLSSVTDPLFRATAFAYDPVGNLTGTSYANGNQTSHTYTDDNQLAGSSYSSESTTWSFSYAATDALTQAQRNDGKTWGFTYDAGNRLQTASDQNNSALGLFTFAFGYDGTSNLTSLDPGPLAPWTYTYNARSELTGLVGPGGSTSFSHDPGGRLTQIATPDESTRSLTYDPAGRPTQVVNTTASGAQTFTYTHDASGNVLSENQATYAYDALNRLTSSYDPGTGITTSYAYDAAGNLTGVQENGVPTETYTFNAANEITNAGYVYDLNGNLTADGTRAFTYDAEDRLVEVSDALGTVASMTYDFTGRRTSLTTQAGTTYFHYAGDLLVAESDANGTVTAAYTYGDGGLVSMTRGGQTYFYQTNAHGDVVSLTDSSGQVVNTYSYDPWGKILSASETVQNPFRYASYYYDTEIGLYYLWHRYYDPELRRFLTLDPLGGALPAAQSLNRYAYVRNNPLSLVDPSGLCPADESGQTPSPWVEPGVPSPWTDPDRRGRDAYEYWEYEWYNRNNDPLVDAACLGGMALAALPASAEVVLEKGAEMSLSDNTAVKAAGTVMGIASAPFTGQNIDDTAWLAAPAVAPIKAAAKLGGYAIDLAKEVYNWIVH